MSVARHRWSAIGNRCVGETASAKSLHDYGVQGYLLGCQRDGMRTQPFYINQHTAGSGGPSEWHGREPRLLAVRHSKRVSRAPEVAQIGY